MRTSFVCVGLTLVLAAAGLAVALAGDCNLSTTEPASYREKCGKAVKKDKIRPGKCGTCETPAGKAEYRVNKIGEGRQEDVREVGHAPHSTGKYPAPRPTKKAPPIGTGGA